MMYLLGPISFLLRFGVLIILSILTVLAIMAWEDSCIVSIGLLAFVAFIVHYSRPVVLPDFSQFRPQRAPPIDHPPERMFEEIMAVAARLGASPPKMLSLTPSPVLQVDIGFHWGFPPRLMRRLTVGLPILATMNMSEFKAAAGHTMAFNSGGAVWFLPAASRVLRWCWRAIDWILDQAWDDFFLIAVMLMSLVSCLLLCSTTTGDIEVPFIILGIGLRFLAALGVPVFVAMLTTAMIVWLVARWLRRRTLLVDQLVAKHYGRNVLLQALPKVWATQHWFDLLWPSLARDSYRNLMMRRSANTYVSFRDWWAGMPKPLYDKTYQQVTTGFYSLFYYVPVFSDRRELVAQAPVRLVDDRSAAQLLPYITEIGEQMTADLLTREQKNRKER
jgi:hypothetical protein